MKSEVDKWVVVNGKIFRLDRVLDNVYDALLLQRALIVTCDVHLTRTECGKWAVYWRSKKEKVECTPKLPSVAPI